MKKKEKNEQETARNVPNVKYVFACNCIKFLLFKFWPNVIAAKAAHFSKGRNFHSQFTIKIYYFIIHDQIFSYKLKLVLK